MHILSEAIAFVVGFVAALLGTLAYELLRIWWARHPIGSALNFDHQHDAVFVYPLRVVDKPILVPRIAIEDFIAVNDMQRMLVSAGWSIERIRMKDETQLQPQERQLNLVILSAPWRNTITKEALNALRPLLDKYEIGAEQAPDGTRRVLFRGGAFVSPTYEQERKLEQEGKQASAGPLEDYALVLKVRNPWNHGASMVVVMGLRGIGTWGAAVHLRDQASQIGRRTKGQDFGMVVKVRYESWNIVRTEEHAFFVFG
jgi:hypothetical protein